MLLTDYGHSIKIYASGYSKHGDWHGIEKTFSNLPQLWDVLKNYFDVIDTGYLNLTLFHHRTHKHFTNWKISKDTWHTWVGEKTKVRADFESFHSFVKSYYRELSNPGNLQNEISPVAAIYIIKSDLGCPDFEP